MKTKIGMVNKMDTDFERIDEWYKKMRIITRKLEPFGYGVDKIKPHSVYIWFRDENEEENVFDIEENNICMYVKHHEIPAEVMPIIEEVQELLRSGW